MSGSCSGGAAMKLGKRAVAKVYQLVSCEVCDMPWKSRAVGDRVPDRLDESAIGEIKVVLRLEHTSELRDYLIHAVNNGLTFVLWVNGDAGGRQTLIDAPLIAYYEAGRIEIRVIPGTGAWRPHWCDGGD